MVATRVCTLLKQGCNITPEKVYKNSTLCGVKYLHHIGVYVHLLVYACTINVSTSKLSLLLNILHVQSCTVSVSKRNIESKKKYRK